MNDYKKDLRPPRLIDRFLEWFIPEHLLEDVQGDLHEVFYKQAQQMGEARARKEYLLTALRYIRPYFFKRRKKSPYYAKPLYTDMLRHYFTISWRNLLKNKLQSSINITGLAVGMACCGVLLLFVLDELNHDGFHVKKNQLHQVWKRTKNGDEIGASGSTPVPLASALLKDVPQVRNASRMDHGTSPLMRAGEVLLQEEGHHVDASFLTMFSFPLLKGNPNQVLQAPNSIVLTQSFARRLFNDQDPMGKVIQLDNKESVVVTGILADVPENSTLQFNFLLPWAHLEQIRPWMKESDWGNNSFRTFVELQPAASIAAAERHILPLFKKYSDKPAAYQQEFFLHPMNKWHLYNEFKNGVSAGGNIEYIRLFTWIALGVLLIACINFMNLSTARSMQRAKEVGIRKVVGAKRSILAGQFLGESLLMAFLAFILAIVLTELTLPFFNHLTDEHLKLDYTKPAFWLSALTITFLTGIIAGSYPALYLSGFQPIKVLKGIFPASHSGVKARRILVVSQFAFSSALIIATLLVYKQIQYIKNRPAGYQQENLVFAWLQGDMEKNFELIRSEAMQAGLIQNATLSNHAITNSYQSTSNVVWQGKPADLQMEFDMLWIDYEFIQTHGIQLKEGRNFSPDFGMDSLGVLLNEEAVKLMGLKQPVGQTINIWDEKRQIIGVFKNFIWGSPFEHIPPMVVVMRPVMAQVITARLNAAKPAQETLAGLQEIIKKHNPNYPPSNFEFVDTIYQNKFKLETLVSKLATAFTGLAIFVSCLGLFGLATFTAEQRTKEIGIRKVLGASLGQIWFTLSKDFLKLTALSLLIGSPIAWYFMHEWLQKYDLRTNISFWVFGLTGIALLGIALLTVSYQSIKAALANPVESLRNE